MIVIYLIKDKAIAKINGTRESIYKEMWALHEHGWTVVDRAQYEQKRKDIRATPRTTKSRKATP